MSIDYWNNAHENKYSKADWSSKPSVFARQVTNHLPKQGKLLEIGTGQGQDANFFQSLGYEVTATDFSDVAIKNAEEKVDNVEFLKVDTTSGLPFKNESFDIVYSHLALHYFDNSTTEKVFKDIHRVLKPGGFFATITNTVDDPEKEEYNYEKIEEGYYQDPRGVKKRYFSVETFATFTKDLFETLLLDQLGTTHKDNLDTLIRYVGKKKR